MMSTRNQIKAALIGFVLAAVALATWQGRRTDDPEPVYHGRGLRTLLENYEQDALALHLGARPEETSGAEDAIRALVTNAIPTLLAMLRKRDSALHLTLIRLWKRHLTPRPWVPDWLRHPAWLRTPAVAKGRLAFVLPYGAGP